MHIRLKFIDIAKGLGILAVVIGHMFPAPWSKLMYMFHMPLFFFIGGYLFKPNKNFKDFFISKSIQLLIPYLFYSVIIYYGFAYLLYGSDPTRSIKQFAIFLSQPVLGGLWLAGYVTVFWFVTVFFITQQVFNYLIISCETKTINYLMILSLLISYFNSLLHVRFPWDANVVTMALPIFYLGHLYIKYDFKVKSILLIFSIISAIAIFIITNDNYMDMKSAEYGIPLVSLASAIIIILGIFNLSKFVTNLSMLSFGLSLIGECSIIIMFLHQPIQLLIKNYVSEDIFLRFSLSIIISIIIYSWAKKSVIGRMLFIGSKKDFYQFFGSKSIKEKSLLAPGLVK